MKVLLVTSMYPSVEKKYSGIFVKNQFECLKKQMEAGEEIDIFFMRRKITSKLGSITKHIKAFFRFIPFLFKSYDVIHLHSFFPLIFTTWLYKLCHPRAKFVVTFHGMEVNIQVNQRNQKIMRFFARKIDFTIPVGQEVANNVKKKLKLPIGKILPVGVDPTTFYAEEASVKKYDFIYVGSFFEVKGIDILYQNIKTLSKDIRFCIVGNGDAYVELFQALIAEGYSIDLKVDQSHEQLRKLYNQSNFLILPSRSEGFATVIVEAMYCGTPVVTSDIPQFREQVIEEENGYTFPLAQPEKLGELLGNLMTLSPSEYQNLSQGALHSFRNLSLDTICKELLTIYRS